jgi:hypothetical protein
MPEARHTPDYWSRRQPRVIVNSICSCFGYLVEVVAAAQD